MTDLHEQAFVAHRGEIAARNADVGEILRSNLTSFPSKGNSAFSQGWLRISLRPYTLGAITFAFPNAVRGLSWRCEGSIRSKNGSFI
ncbi:hypothetical protein [Sphingobium sp. BS19]|uniref:hypothetical protein n=1 Tax=Sphingobium sp. BS19 TaxID=3018973 RepID=UPI0024937ACD|nr:hypothetical protein [Sphingobium sp. BS19]